MDQSYKKITSDIALFIEDIVLKYNLEKDFIEKDVLLKKKLDGITNPAERISLKFLYSQEIGQYIENNKPLEEILTSVKIKKIVEQLINKKIEFGDISSLLSQNIKAEPEIIKSIEEEIKNNPKIKEAIEGEPTPILEENYNEEQDLNKKTNTKSIGNMLLKGD